jgi:hypothetical protein
MASAAIPAEIKRDPGRINILPSPPSGVTCRFAPRTCPPTRSQAAKKHSNCGKEWSRGSPSYGGAMTSAACG